MADNSEQEGKQRTMSILSFGSKNRKNRKSIGPASIFEDTPKSPTRPAKKTPSYNPNPAEIYGAQPGAWPPLHARLIACYPEISSNGKLAADNVLTMGSIRSMQHRDTNGEIISMEYARTMPRYAKLANIKIADPDRSNPTRPRLERPLATIMSFHAAVDGVYGERAYSKSGWWRDFRPEMKSS